MGFTYTDSDKVVLEAWGKFKVTLYETVEPGDLLSFYNTDNDYTVQHADESSSYRADCIAMEAGVQGDEIMVCQKAMLKTISTIATGGVVTRVYFAAEADFLGAILYLGEDGKPESDTGDSYQQIVGRLVARDQILIDLNPIETGILMEFTDADGGGVGIKVVMQMTTTAAIGSYAIEGQCIYTPSTITTGGSAPVGVKGMAQLSALCTSTLYMWGVQAQLDFADTSILNCSQVAALRAVVTNTGNTTWTGGGLACIYADQLVDDDTTGLSSSVICRFTNHNGAIDSAIEIRAFKTTNMWSFQSSMAASQGPIGIIQGGGGTVTFTNYQLIKVLIGTNTCYLIAAQTIT